MNGIERSRTYDEAQTDLYVFIDFHLYRAGVLTGSDATGNFHPQTYITRAEAAAILSRMAESGNRVKFALKK